LGVGVVGGARVVKGEVDVALTLKTIRDALDFLQNPNTITFVTLRLFREKFHRLAALAPDDHVSRLQITIEIVSARAIS